MAKYAYEQLKKDQNERQKLLNTLRELREQKDVWDNVFPDEEDRHYRAAREKTTSLLNRIERMEGILGDTKNDRRADFDEAMKELGDSMKSFRYDRIFGQGYEALRERVPGLDDIATGIGLASFGTADDIAERYRYIANLDYDAMSREEEMECVTGFLALHEQVGNAKAPGEKRFDHTTFAQIYDSPVKSLENS